MYRSFLVHVSFAFLLAFSLVANAVAEVKQYQDIEYANVNGQSLKLDLYIPTEVKQPKLVVWIHGGGWIKGSKNNPPLQWLTEQGHALASISYRFTDKAIFPAQIYDCKGAVRWLRANEEKYGYSTEKVAVAGASAGGMLAALMGTSAEVEELEGNVGGNLNESSRVHAVVDYFGATDFALRSQTQPHRANEPGTVVYKLFGGGANEKVELAKLASAVSFVTADDAPMLVIHGEQDKVVLPDQSEKIADVYRKANLPIKLIMIKGAGHGGKEFFAPEQKKQVLEFLNKTFKK